MFPWLGNHLVLHAFAYVLLPLLFFKLITRGRHSKLQLPPSPWKLPILGNLLQLGSLPHRNLRSLAQKHGPLMLLHFGLAPTLIVSSADASKEIFKTQDLNFLSRPKMKVGEVLFYSSEDIGLSPYGEYWKQVRKIAVSELLSVRRTESFRSVQKEEVDLMVEKISQSCHANGVVDLTKILMSLALDITCRVALGRKYSEDGGDWDFLKMIREGMLLVGTFNVGDFIPWLAWVNHLNGYNTMLERTSKKMDSFLESVITEHIHHSGSEGRVEDFVDVLLQVETDGSINGVPFTRDNIKAVLLDMFMAGTDPTSSSVVWAMTELIRHPDILKKVQREIRDICNGKEYVNEDDLEEMNYMKMVIKETLRLHPPNPLLAPRESIQHAKIFGYDIPAKTRVITNFWAIGRDPRIWDSPESFLPERFLDTTSSYRGVDFKYIPFGAGRRSCPGMVYSIPNMELPLANLLYHFDWNFPNGTSSETMDVKEGFGIIAFKKTPLILVPTLRPF